MNHWLLKTEPSTFGVEDLAKAPGVKLIPWSPVSPGPDPSVYAFEKRGADGNLFRITLPR